jgi:hypothetical protein
MDPLHPDGAMAKIIGLANTWEARARKAEAQAEALSRRAIVVSWTIGAACGATIAVLACAFF